MAQETFTRKVNLVGSGTLTVSLPFEFIDAEKIQKGDELKGLIKDHKLCFYKNDPRDIIKEVTFPMLKNNKHLFIRQLTKLYIGNYDRILVTNCPKNLYDYKEKKYEDFEKFVTRFVKKRFLGAEIIEISSEGLLIECFVRNEKEELERVEKRVFELFEKTIDKYALAVKENSLASFSKDAYRHHDEITRFVNYLLRKIESNEENQLLKKEKYAFYTFLDSLVDKLRDFFSKIGDPKVSQRVNTFALEIFDFFLSQYKHLLDSYCPSKEVLVKKYEILERLESTPFSVKEAHLVLELKNFLLSTIRFYDLVFIIRIEKESFLPEK